MLCALSWKASFVVTRSCFALPERRVSVVVASGWHTNFQRTCFFPSEGACGLAARYVLCQKDDHAFYYTKGIKSFHPREVREFQYQIKAARRSPQCHGGSACVGRSSLHFRRAESIISRGKHFAERRSTLIKSESLIHMVWLNACLPLSSPLLTLDWANPHPSLPGQFRKVTVKRAPLARSL